MLGSSKKFKIAVCVTTLRKIAISFLQHFADWWGKVHSLAEVHGPQFDKHCSKSEISEHPGNAVVKYVHSTWSTPLNSVYILHVIRETCFLCVNCFKCQP